ncbi:MAG: DUF1631 family protein [Xanthomonadales bacterium]|nr:DUF1631 family protein [Xanthomonadales bacterium]
MDATAREEAKAQLEFERRLEPGVWVSFLGEDGQRVPAKLSWKSPVSRKLLFVNANGLKVADRKMEEVLDELSRGEAVIMATPPG